MPGGLRKPFKGEVLTERGQVRTRPIRGFTGFQFQFAILSGQRQIENLLLRSLIPRIKRAMIQVAKKWRQEKVVELAFLDSLRQTEGYRAIAGQFQNDSLKDIEAVLGIPSEIQSFILPVIEKFLTETIKISVADVGTLKAIRTPSLLIRGIPRTTVLRQLPQIPGAVYVSDSKRRQRKRGEQTDIKKLRQLLLGKVPKIRSREKIYWLRWLLMRKSPVINNFFLLFGKDIGKSFLIGTRTGRAMMAERDGANWTIDQHVDAIDSGQNFIDAAIEHMETSQKPKLLRKAFEDFQRALAISREVEPVTSHF